MTTPSGPEYGSGYGDGQQPLTPPPIQQNQQQGQQGAQAQWGQPGQPGQQDPQGQWGQQAQQSPQAPWGQPGQPQDQWGQQAPQDSAAWGQASQGAAPQQPYPAPGQQQAPQWGQASAATQVQAYPQQQPGFYPAAPQPKRRNKALIIRLSIFGVIAAIALISVLVKHFSAAKVDANGNVTKAGSLSVFSLQKGQCFNEPGTGASVSSITAIPCTSAHDAQVTGNVTLSESTYDETALDTDAGNQCQTVADSVVDQTKLGSDASIIYFVPNSDDWNSGDHSATCAVDENGTKITGTVLKAAS